MKRFFCLIGLICVLTMVCANDRAEFVLGDGDNGKSVTALKGANFYVKLTSNSSTGYSWYVDGKLSNIKQVGKSTYSDKDPNKPPGAGGEPQWQTFKFLGVKVGTVTLKLRYYRSWEKKKDSDTIWKVKVKVYEIKKTPKRK